MDPDGPIRQRTSSEAQAYIQGYTDACRHMERKLSELAQIMDLTRSTYERMQEAYDDEEEVEGSSESR